MNNETKHYNHNHGKDGRFTFGSSGNTISSRPHNSTVKDVDGRPVGEEKPVKGKKGLLHESSKIFFDPERYQISGVEGPNDYAGFLQYSSNSPALKKKFPHLTQNKNTTGMIFARNESANNPTGVLHIKRDKNGENKIDFLWTYGNKKDDVKYLYPYELFDIAHNVYGVKSGNKPGEIPLIPEVSEYIDGITNKKKIHEDYTQSFNTELIKNNTNKNGEFEYGLSARKGKNMNKTNYIQHGRGPNKHHKYIKIENGKYIYPKDLVNKVTKIRDKVDLKRRRNYIKHGRGPSKRHKYIKIENGRYIYPKNLINKDAVKPIVKRANNESRIRQKNGGYAVPKNSIERRAEYIVRINQRNGKFTNRKKNNNAVGTIANAARNARRNAVRPNNYGYDRTTNYGKPKMNTVSNAAERAFNSMKMPKVRKVKKSKLSEFKKKLKKKIGYTDSPSVTIKERKRKVKK